MSRRKLTKKGKAIASKTNAIIAITNAKSGGTKWHHYCTARRSVSISKEINLS